MIRRTLRYGVYVRTAVQEALVFQVDFWAGIGVALLTMFLSFYLWRAVYGAERELAGMSLAQMMSYLVVSALVQGALAGGVIGYVGQGFLTGTIGVDLLRPLSFPGLCLARSAGSAAVYFLTRGLPVFLVGAVVVGLRLPGPAEAAAFLAALALAFVLYFLLEFILAQLTLFTEAFSAVSQIWELLVVFCTGALLPLAFFPDWARQVLFAMPFHGIFYTPINLFLGGELEAGPVVRALAGLGLDPTSAALLEQLLWIAVLAPLAALAWRASSRRLVVQGG